MSLKIVKTPDMYFKDGGTVFKLTKEKYPTLYQFIVLKRETIVNDYNEWLTNQKNDSEKDIVFPRIVVAEKFFTRLQKEARTKVRCYDIYWGDTNTPVTRIMGVGYYNKWLYELIENRKNRKKI